MPRRPRSYHNSVKKPAAVRATAIALLPSLSRRCLAETVGTFALVFAGTGAVVVNDTHGGAVTHVGIALTFGLVVTAMIYALGPVSGSHLNPAVTLALTAAGAHPRRDVLPYFAAQVAGAFLASGLLALAFPQHGTLGATLPAGAWGVSWAFEFVLTAILLVVVRGCQTGPAAWLPLIGVAVGATIGLEAMFAGPVCGASMNPARSLAPAVVSGHVEFLAVYLTAPFLGALAGVGLSRLLFTNPPEESS